MPSRRRPVSGGGVELPALAGAMQRAPSSAARVDPPQKRSRLKNATTSVSVACRHTPRRLRGDDVPLGAENRADGQKKRHTGEE